MTTTQTIITARWVIPVEPQNTALEGHAVVIENARIVAICTVEKALKKYPEAARIDRPNHVLMPGFVNAHTHAAMNLFKGLADDLPLMDWLTNHIWPAEANWVSSDFVRDGVELATAEMLLSGTTCFSDMYFYPDIVAATAQEAGIRACVGLIVLDFPSVWASDSDQYFEKGLQVHDTSRSLSLIETALAPHAPYTVSDDPLRKVRTYADELQVQVHMHIHETAQEIEDAIEKHGQRPLARLHSLGLLNPRLIAVHMTQLDDDEVKLCVEQGVHIVHCPESNHKLASGQCRVAELLDAGANVCLGTDSAASNNDLDMFGEMRCAAFSAKMTAADASTLPAWQVLQMATLNGAKALNLQEETGSLVVGKSADMIAVDLNHVSTQPVYDPISQIVYSAAKDQVSDVWVQGKHVVDNKNLTTLDIDKILQKAQNWGNRIAAGRTQTSNKK